MKILVAVLMTALFVFAVATAWVDYVQPQLNLIALAATPKAVDEPALVMKKRPRKVHVEPDVELLQVPSDDNADSGAGTPRKVSKTRVAAPPADNTRSLLNDQLEEVKERESRVAARQEALRMLYDDIRSELATLDELRKRTSDELAVAERGRPGSPRLSASSQETDAVAPHGRAGLTNVPVSLKNITGNPATRTQALIMKRLVDDGKMETAVSLLKAMKGREAAGVLESLSSVDSLLARRLADSIPAIADAPVRR